MGYNRVLVTVYLSTFLAGVATAPLLLTSRSTHRPDAKHSLCQTIFRPLEQIILKKNASSWMWRCVDPVK
jgi:hypothetical protein